MTDTEFDLDDEPVPTPEGEVAAAICRHEVVMQRRDALTADMLDEFHGFVQEELAALLEEKNAEIAYLRAIANGKFADAAQMALHHAAGRTRGGINVTRTAFELGYGSSSAFIYAFRTAMG